jgi:hypothetical protein
MTRERFGRASALLIAVAACLLAAPVAAAVAADPAEALYQSNRVDVIELTLDPAELSKLEAEPEEYVKGTFSLAETNGTPGGVGSFSTPRPVEVRLKGDASFKDLDEKAAFKLKFKEADAFLGLRKMTLNNMVEDPSMTHETLAYTAFRAAGVPAPRSSFAYVYLNEKDYGLHLDLETLDKLALEKRFGAFVNPQHLYEGESGVDVRTGEDLSKYEVDEGDKVNRADLEALVGAVNSSGPEPWSTRVAPFADLTEMTRMWAVEKYAGQYDGYASGASPFQPNNYYLYSNPAGQFQMLPWGTDETWQEKNHLAFDDGHGLLFTHCLKDAACTTTYRQSLAVTCGAIGGAGLDSLAVATAGLLAPWQQLEQGNGARHEHDLGEIADGVAETRAFVASRPAEAAAFLGEPCASVPVPAAASADETTAAAGSAPDPDGFRVGRVRAEGTLLQTEVHLPTAGVVDQLVTISTADGQVVVGRKQVGYGQGRDLSLRSRLSRALGERLWARWVRVKIVTAFQSKDGQRESVTRHKRLPRLES